MANIVRRTFANVLNRVTSFIGPNRMGAIFMGPYKLPGITLNAYEALRLSAVWACISVISKTLAASEWQIFNQKANGDRDYQNGSKTYYLLNYRPNREMTAFSFHEAILVQALVWGKGFAEIDRDAMNRVAALWPLDPDRSYLVRGFIDEDGLFRYNDSTGELFVRVMNINKPDTFLRYDDVYHIHGLSIDGLCGLDMVAVAARPLLMMLASESFRLKFYQHGTSMGGILTTEKDLDQPDLDVIKKNVQDRVGGVENAFQFLVLGGGLKWESLTPDFDKAQFIETNYLMIEEICRYWGVPPHKIAHLLRATFSNIEHQGIEFTRDGCKPWAKRCEQELDYKILPAGPMGISIDLTWAAEGDAKSVAETDAILATNGFVNRNTINKKRGRNSIGPAGDAYTIQSNMTTIERVIDGSNLKSNAPESGGGPGGAAAPASEPKPARGMVAASALMFNAVRRSLERLTTRVGNERWSNRIRFERWLKDNAAATVVMTKDNIAEAIATLETVGAPVLSYRTEAIEEMCAENMRLLLAAYDNRTLTAWCDIEDRAKSTVAAMEIVLDERGQ